MPADVTLNSGSGGAIIATDPTTSSEHYQLIKTAYGAVGTFNLVTSAAGLPIASASSGLVQISGIPTVVVASSAGLTQTVTVLSASSGVIQLSSQITVTATGPVTVTSGTVTLSSVHTVTATAATNPWSSAPGFNIPTVSVSSGLSQVSAIQVSPTSSVAGAGLVVITSSFGLVTQSTQPITITSGTVTLSSVHTVTATAATNPWSSSPGFNVPVVSVSSGLIQLSSQITVTATGPVTITSGLISVTSGTITSTSATNPWSSAPGFNIPVVNVSSGLVQSFQVGTWTVQTTAGTAINTSSAIGLPVFHAITATSSVAGAAIAPVTSSAGLLANLSSGTVSLSSQITVTATAATNPWSSAPGFNVPVVTVSSGLVQVSGVPLVAVTSSVQSGVTIFTTGIAPVLVTSSGGPVFSAGVNTAAGYGPVTSSAGRLGSLSSGTVTLSSVHTVVAASSGVTQILTVPFVSTVGLRSFSAWSTGAVVVTNITTAQTILAGWAIYNSTAAIRGAKIYNSTAPTAGSTAGLIAPVTIPGSTGGGGSNMSLTPLGVFTSNGLSMIITSNPNATDTGTAGANDVAWTLFYV